MVANISPSAGVARDYPYSIARVEENNILLANGVDAMLRWSGLDGTVETAGVAGPTAAMTVTLLSAGNITLTSGSSAYFRFYDNKGNVSNLSPLVAVPAGTNKRIQYTGVAVSSNTNVVKRQIFRTLDGTSNVAYLDGEIGDNTTTTLISNNRDAEIQLRESVVLSDSDGVNQANRHDPPPNHKACLAVHLGRVFAAVEVNYTRGNIQVTNGSPTIVGIDTRWTSAMEGRTIYVLGATASYTISSISSVDSNGRQTATLSSNFSGTTNKFARYALRSSPAYRRTVHYSASDEPESWPATNLITVQETGDEVVGLISHQSFLYILERNHIHRLTYQNDPVEDGAVFLLANRGCINNRCWVVVEDQILMLDEQGIHSYDGGRASQQISTPIQELFRRGVGGYRINFLASKFFHASHYPKQEMVRWFVAMSGTYLPRHAIAYHYRLNRWWIEEYPRPMGCSALATFGQQRLLAASTKTEVFALDEGSLDGPGVSGDAMLDVASAEAMSLTYVTGTLPTEGVVGSLACIVSGRGKGQTREIVEHDSATKTLWMKTYWFEVPDETSRFVIGGIPWLWRSGLIEWPVLEREASRKVELTFTPTTEECSMDVAIYADFSADPKEMALARDDEGLSYESGDDGFTVDLGRTIGRVEQRLDSGRSSHTSGERLISVEMQGFGTRATPEVHEVVIGGAQQAGG